MRLLLVYFLLFVALRGDAERTKNKIYVNVDSRAACFKRLNATHQIGCTSEPNGNVGVVHYINSEADIKWLVEQGPHQPYAVLLNDVYFNHDVVSRLRGSRKINGLMVIHVENSTLSPTPDSFSPDTSCPNDRYGMYKDSDKYKDCSMVKWNSAGQGLMFEDFGFPIFILTDEKDVKFAIEKCYEWFNKPDAAGRARDYPLCAVQLKDRMDGAKDSETCIRRTRHQMNLNPDRYCDPLGDKNVYSMIKDNSSTVRPKKSVIIAAARMDSFSMFENVYPSADNHVSGIVALLAVAEAFGAVKEDIKQDDSKDVMFTFFQGEAFDYIGSGRMVYDMQHDNFPLKVPDRVQAVGLKHISSIVEVNQLAYRDSGKIWIHTDPLTRPNVSSQIDEMVAELQDLGGGLVGEADRTLPLPPASTQTFLKARKDIPALVVTDHQKEYVNSYYNSRFDVATAIQQSYPDGLNDTAKYDYLTEQARNLTEAANVLASFLYKLATGKNATQDLKVNETTITHLLYCFLISPQCELLRQVLDQENANKLASKPYPFYVGVDSQTNEITYIVKNLLFRFLGDITNLSHEQCKEHNKEAYYRYAWMQGPKDVNGTRPGVCMKGLANYSTAVSMAFEKDDYDYSSGDFSTWTESAWMADAMNVRFFLIPSKQFEVATLIAGVLILIASLAGGLFFNKKSSIVFNTSESPDAPAPVSL